MSIYLLYIIQERPKLWSSNGIHVYSEVLVTYEFSRNYNTFFALYLERLDDDD